MSAEMAIAVAILLPALGALLVALLGQSPNLRDGAMLLVATATFIVVCSLYPEVASGGRPTLHLLKVLPGLDLAFQIEPLGMLFSLVASGLWILTSLYAIGYMRGHHEENQTRFFAFFAVAISPAICSPCFSPTKC